MLAVLRPLAIGCVSIHLSLALHAEVRHVGPTGQPHTQIQAAVDAASPGDVILVDTGTYSAFAVTGKALTISSAVGATVLVRGTTLVSGTGTGQVVVLSDLELIGPDASIPGSAAGPGLRVLSNSGNVLVQSCRVRGGQPAGAGYTSTVPPNAAGAMGAQVTSNLGGVVFVDCDVAASAAASASDSQPCCPYTLSAPSAVGLQSQATRLALMTCEVRGGDGAGSGVGGDGGSGVALVGTGGAFLFGGHTRGGQGGPSFETTFEHWGGDGGAGLSVGTSAVGHVFQANLLGGQGGTAQFPSLPGSAGPRMLSQGGWLAHAGSAVRISVPALAHVGSVVPFRAEGAPGTLVKLFAGAGARFHYVPSWRGVLVPTTGAVDAGMTMGVIPASGELNVNYVVPALPSGVSSRNLFVQAYCVEPAGGYALSNARCVTIVP